MLRKPTVKPTAKIDQGYVKIQLDTQPGCLARAEAFARWALWYGLVFGLGVIVGLVWRWG